MGTSDDPVQSRRGIVDRSYQVEQQLGGGYTVGGTVRFGLADKDPNVELTGARTNLSKTIRSRDTTTSFRPATGETRLSFGSSFSALFFGKDEGFYYRSTGGELTWTRGQMSKVRMAALRRRRADCHDRDQFAVFRRTHHRQLPQHRRRRGDLLWWRVACRSQPRTRSARFPYLHGFPRRARERGFGLRSRRRRADDVEWNAVPYRVGLTLSAGKLRRPLPAQRRWYLGRHADRSRPGSSIAQSGNAFWLTRLELGRDNPGHGRASSATWMGRRSRASRQDRHPDERRRLWRVDVRRHFPGRPVLRSAPEAAASLRRLSGSQVLKAATQEKVDEHSWVSRSRTTNGDTGHSDTLAKHGSIAAVRDQLVRPGKLDQRLTRGRAMICAESGSGTFMALSLASTKTPLSGCRTRPPGIRRHDDWAPP